LVENDPPQPFVSLMVKRRPLQKRPKSTAKNGCATKREFKSPPSKTEGGAPADAEIGGPGKNPRAHMQRRPFVPQGKHMGHPRYEDAGLKARRYDRKIVPRGGAALRGSG
jgi:hypothetical protein